MIDRIRRYSGSTLLILLVVILAKPAKACQQSQTVYPVVGSIEEHGYECQNNCYPTAIKLKAIKGQFQIVGKRRTPNHFWITFKNIGATRNAEIEFKAKCVPERNDNLEVSVVGNATTLNNMIVGLPNTPSMGWDRRPNCNPESLWKNMKWCLTPSGKDKKQQTAIKMIRSSGDTGKKWHAAAGYFLCQNQQIGDAFLNQLIGGVVGAKLISIIRDGKGGPIRDAEYCGLDEVYKQAMNVMHCKLHNGQKGGCPK